VELGDLGYLTLLPVANPFDTYDAVTALDFSDPGKYPEG